MCTLAYTTLKVYCRILYSGLMWINVHIQPLAIWINVEFGLRKKKNDKTNAEAKVSEDLTIIIIIIDANGSHFGF